MRDTVLFLYPHRAAKSVLAAAILQQLADERGLPLRAGCAGTEPDPMLAPHVSALLVQEGLALPLERPELVTAEQLAQADYVISLGCPLNELPHQPGRWELWDDLPAPSQDLQGAYAGTRQRLAEWIATYGARSRARGPIEGGER